jgi:hypothetical protein
MAEGGRVQVQILIDSASEASPPRARRSTFVASILGVYLLSRVILLGVVLDVFGAGRALTRLAGIWDGTYYLQIAAHGYPTEVTHRVSSVIAFFPLYPMLVRFVAPVFGGDLAISALAVSLVAGAAACLAVGQLARDRAGDTVGVRAGALFALAPGAAFLSPAYAEGLAISLCALTLIMLDRRRWLAAGVLGALATATSSLALPIVLAALWAAWHAERRQAWMAPALAASGFGSYCVYLWAHAGTPFAWFDAERLGWGGHHVDLLAPVEFLTTWSGVTLVETFSVAVALGGLWAMRRARVPGTWWAYTVPLLVSVMFDAALWLTPRFLLSAFGLVAGAALVLDQRRFRLLAVSSAVVMVLALVGYLSFPDFVFKP